MRRIERLLLTGSGYSILILTIFYAFAAISNFTSPAITFPQYALIVGFGYLIALAELMYNALNLKKWLRGIIHYGVLLLAFCIIFIISGNIKSGRASAIFAAIVLFTMLYFALWGMIHLIRKTANIADDKIESKQPKVKDNKKVYKSLYSSDD